MGLPDTLILTGHETDRNTRLRSGQRARLLVYGEEDDLQPRDPTIKLIESRLDQPGAAYAAIIVPDAQHNLTVQPDSGGRFFWWHEAPGLVDLIGAWILRQPPLKGSAPSQRT